MSAMVICEGGGAVVRGWGQMSSHCCRRLPRCGKTSAAAAAASASQILRQTTEPSILPVDRSPRPPVCNSLSHVDSLSETINVNFMDKLLLQQQLLLLQLQIG